MALIDLRQQSTANLVPVHPCGDEPVAAAVHDLDTEHGRTVHSHRGSRQPGAQGEVQQVRRVPSRETPPRQHRT